MDDVDSIRMFWGLVFFIGALAAAPLVWPYVRTGGGDILTLLFGVGILSGILGGLKLCWDGLTHKPVPI
jgi:hypothetical protein